jgi:hypothetical protein
VDKGLSYAPFLTTIQQSQPPKKNDPSAQHSSKAQHRGHKRVMGLVLQPHLSEDNMKYDLASATYIFWCAVVVRWIAQAVVSLVDHPPFDLKLTDKDGKFTRSPRVLGRSRCVRMFLRPRIRFRMPN